MAVEHIYALDAIRGKRLVTVKVGDMRMSNDPRVTLVTYALGSCVAVTLYDPVRKQGAMLHALLGRADEHEGEGDNPWRYVDRGWRMMLARMTTEGTRRGRLEVKIAGGARVLNQRGAMDIGQYNLTVLREVIARDRMRISGEDVGGQVSRTAMLEIDTGRLTIRAKNEVRVI